MLLRSLVLKLSATSQLRRNSRIAAKTTRFAGVSTEMIRGVWLVWSLGLARGLMDGEINKACYLVYWFIFYIDLITRAERHLESSKNLETHIVLSEFMSAIF